MLTRCSSCQGRLQVADEWLGKKARCPSCQAPFVIAAEAPAAPAPPAPAPANPKPAPLPKTTNNPFAFDDSDPAPESGEGDFDDSPEASPFAISEQGEFKAGVRVRISQAMFLMQTGAGLSLLLGLLAMVSAVLHMNSIAGFLGGVCLGCVLILSAVIVIIGAQMLSRMRSQGMGIVAAIFCCLCFLPGFFGLVSTGLSMFQGRFSIEAPIIFLVCLAQVPCCALGGIRAMFVVFRSDVGEAIRLRNESRTKAEIGE
jgi:hypothetical protein